MSLFSRKQDYRFVDMHIHVLPGIDDGSQNMETTLEMLRIAREEGITDMIVTPHFKQGHHNAGREKIERLIDEVTEAMKAESLDIIHLYPGNEIYYYEGAGEDVAKDLIRSMNGTDRALIEFSPSERYNYIRNAVDEMMGAGFVPILAHVERYMCLVETPDLVRELKEMGAEIQVNASSITGNLGPKVKSFTHRLLKQEIVDYIGTDAHDTGRRAPKVKKCISVLRRLCSDEYLRAITCDNALSIIEA